MQELLFHLGYICNVPVIVSKMGKAFISLLYEMQPYHRQDSMMFFKFRIYLMLFHCRLIIELCMLQDPHSIKQHKCESDYLTF